ncbi:unnamed protein product [Camellia sinensis]
MLSTAASLYPVYVTVGGIVACLRPSTFSWFVKRGPTSYSFALGFIMLAMGLTLELREFFSLFLQRPLSVSLVHNFLVLGYEQILFGFVAQYTIMPSFGWIISKTLGLPPAVSVGLILLACCPGGTASNVSTKNGCLVIDSLMCNVLTWQRLLRAGQGHAPCPSLGTMALIPCYTVLGRTQPRKLIVEVTLIAQGDVPLSIVMTVCTTLGAVILTPLLTKILAGTFVPVDAVKLSISTMQVVVAPILLGSYMQSTFPAAVKVVTPFGPLLAVLTSSLLACSVFSENVVRLKSSVVVASVSSEASPLLHARAILSGELGVIILSVLLLHFAGFFVGYISAAISGFREPQRRAISIEVGMQNSSLGVVLATSHFTSPMVALPPALSAVLMNIMGSSLGFFWIYVDPSDSQTSPKVYDQ